MEDNSESSEQRCICVEGHVVAIGMSEELAENSATPGLHTALEWCEARLVAECEDPRRHRRLQLEIRSQPGKRGAENLERLDYLTRSLRRSIGTQNEARCAGLDPRFEIDLLRQESRGLESCTQRDQQ